ncbi:MAG: hypothetical protein ACYC0Y_21115, partial [Pirellulales bacterium]
WRPVIWSGLAVAAALVVMFLNRPGFLGEGPVDKGRVAIAPSVAESTAEGIRADRGLVRGERAAAGREPRSSAPALAVESQAGDAMKEKLAVKFSEERPAAETLAKDRLDTKVLSAPARAGERAGRMMKEARGKSEAPVDTGLAVQERASDDAAATQLRSGRESLDRSQKGVGGYGGMGGMGSPGPAGMGGGAPMGGAAPAAQFGSPMRQMDKVAASDKKAASTKGEALGEPLLVVQCEITPEAARSHAFDNVLLKQRIAWGGAGEGVITEGKPLKALAEKGDHRDNVARQWAEGTGALGDVDLVYVEAAPEQVQATLTELSNRSDLFLAVAVNPTPGSQLDSFQYRLQDVGGGQGADGVASGTVNGALGARRLAKAKVAATPPAPADGAFRAGGRQGIARRIRLFDELGQQRALETAKTTENQPQQAKPDLSHYADTPVELKAAQAVPSAPSAKPADVAANKGEAAKSLPEQVAPPAAGQSSTPAKGQEVTAPKTPAVVPSPSTVAKESPPADSSVGRAQRPSTGAMQQQAEFGTQQSRPATMRVLFVVRVVQPSSGTAAVAMPANQAAEPPAKPVPAEQTPAEKPSPAVQAAPVKP